MSGMSYAKREPQLFDGMIFVPAVSDKRHIFLARDIGITRDFSCKAEGKGEGGMTYGKK